ncbi:hypothetical protein Leryth_010409 [Lithospermum erythrorhizon]|nr:hypothetical protein Leryth_010409 [Lithospermum erythrorhizon]
MDPLFHLLRHLPFSFLRPPRLRLKLPTLPLPVHDHSWPHILPTYFMALLASSTTSSLGAPSGLLWTLPRTASVVFMSGRVNGQYIIEGLSSGFMFVLGGLGIVMLDMACDKNRDRSLKVSYGVAGVGFVVVSYVMSMLFIRIKIPGYLR